MTTKFAIILAAFSLTASAIATQPAAARPYRRHAERYAYGSYGSDLRPNYPANWRWRSNYGWDNTCFNLPYLSSEFACSSHGR